MVAAEAPPETPASALAGAGVLVIFLKYESANCKKVGLIATSGVIILLGLLFSLTLYQPYKRHNNEEKHSKQLANLRRRAAELKTFTDIGSLPGLAIEAARLETKFIDEELFYLLLLNVEKGHKPKLPNSFTIELRDKDGFIVYSFKVDSSRFVSGLNESGILEVYSCQGQGPVDLSKYSRVSDWHITWIN